MALIIYGDVHLGVRRSANTTPAGRARLQQCIWEAINKILDKPGEKIGLGDLLDTYSNDESVIAQAASIVERTGLTIAGNHDLTPDADKLGSLELIKGQYQDKVVLASFGEVGIDVRVIGDTRVVSIPHHTTQSLFEGALEMATGAVTADSILLFHANFDSPYELSETSINLTQEWAERLLNSGYRYIIGGHEHNGRELYDGRLVMLGNIFPNSFHDATSSKRIALLDEAGIRFERIWDVKTGYVRHPADAIPDSTEAQFVDIYGEVPSSEISAVSKAVSRLGRGSPNLLGLRSTVQIVGLDQEVESTTAAAETLPALIERELQPDPALLNLWKEFTA